MPFVLINDENKVVGVSHDRPFAAGEYDANLAQVQVNGGDPAPGQIYDPVNHSFSNPAPPLSMLTTLAAMQRGQRMDAGVEFQGRRFQTRQQDLGNIDRNSQAAMYAILKEKAKPGDLRWHGGDEDFAWIDANNSLVPMDAQTMVEFGRAVSARQSKVALAARSIKDLIANGQITGPAQITDAFNSAGI